MARPYQLGRRQESVDRTAASILAAARDELQGRPAHQLSVGSVARRAGVTRATVYNRFGSRAGLMDAVAPSHPAGEPENGEPREAVHEFLLSRCVHWAAGPTLHRHLAKPDEVEIPRRIAERLAAADALRPGCSLKEAQDVLAMLGSFAVFDRLHQDGRRSASAVAEILMRLAGGVLAFGFVA